MNKKIIFLDIDGTFTPPGQNEAPASAVQAVRQTRALGNLVFISSGRNTRMLAPILQYGFDGYIASSGGYIVYNEQVLYDCPMAQDQLERAMRILKKNGIYQTIECRDISYTDEAFKDFLSSHACEGHNSELLRWRRQLEAGLGIYPMKDYDGRPVYKIVLMMTSRKQLDEPIRLLSDTFTFCIQGSDRFGIVNAELIQKTFNKGQALLRICHHLKHPREDTLAFGDSMNDLEMLQAAGYSVCMNNGSEQLKSLADLVCPAVEEDGLYKAFLTCGLLGEPKDSQKGGIQNGTGLQKVC